MERKWIIASAFLSTLLIASLAQAQVTLLPSWDSKTFSGNICQPYYGNQSGDFQHRWNGMVNVSAGGRYISCPVVRDNTTNTNGTGLKMAVYVNNVSGQNLTCYFRSNDSFGHIIQSDADGTTLGGDQTSSLAVTKSASSGNYSFYCWLPENSRIASYQLFEYNPTDNYN